MKLNPPTAERIRRITQMKQATAYLAALASNVKLLWACACRAEGIEITEKFVIFKAENPFLARYNAAISQLWKARGAYEQGGLCAIEIQPLAEEE